MLITFSALVASRAFVGAGGVWLLMRAKPASYYQKLHARMWDEYQEMQDERDRASDLVAAFQARKPERDALGRFVKP